MLLRALALSATLLAGTVAPADASTRTVTVDGAVATPASYTASQLKAFGGDLTRLVAAATPVLPPGKHVDQLPLPRGWRTCCTPASAI
jgi:hypothetical protein